MFITRYSPNTQIKEFRRGFDLLNTMLDEISEKREYEFKGDFTPTINTREGEYTYHVEVDLPGIKKDDIKIQIEDSTLVITGERKHKDEVKEENYYKIESDFGSFSRSFTLPEEVDVENIHAESQDGVLEVVIPKLKNTKVDKVKKIEIK
ncbi:MAG: Hsp20/alpha crystallin family protein [Sulfurimonas sp.]|nr:Hsp20/alpha crystallin family protein [Sulfurimonas sp.]